MANKTNLSIGAIIVILVAAYLGIDLKQEKSLEQVDQSFTTTTSSDVENIENSTEQKQIIQPKNSSLNHQNQQGLDTIRQAYETKLSNIQVQSSGKVKAILKDDREGSQHQKFILALENGLTVLVAHNIDLAPRLENLQKGDLVKFFGEYEYSEQGGVIHWTHHDPNRHHEDGWLKHNGQISR